MRRARFAHSGSKLINLAGFLVPQERSASRAESLLARTTVAARRRRDASVKRHDGSGSIQIDCSFCKFDTASTRRRGSANAGEAAVVPRLRRHTAA